ncbi:MAG: FAD-dependent oxidoreductase, partial [Byssovorax sp.]
LNTVATQAFQLWMTADMAELGWLGGPASVSGFVEPFDTWADMTHVLRWEQWELPVKSIAYFCSVLPDPCSRHAAAGPVLVTARNDEVRKNAVGFLDHHIGWLWPDAVQRGEFRWEVLADKSPAEGEKRFFSQYWRANVAPTDRYVVSLPGTIQHRISPLDMIADNLTVAGDWTASGLNSGCVESAVMSGLLAAHALSKSPRLEDIIGYDHP